MNLAPPIPFLVSVTLETKDTNNSKTHDKRVKLNKAEREAIVERVFEGEDTQEEIANKKIL